MSAGECPATLAIPQAKLFAYNPSYDLTYVTPLFTQMSSLDFSSWTIGLASRLWHVFTFTYIPIHPHIFPWIFRHVLFVLPLTHGLVPQRIFFQHSMYPLYSI
jgi:hypothetical protein